MSCQYSGSLRDCYNRLEKRAQPYVSYNSNLKCPELSPWLQKLTNLKKAVTKRTALQREPKNVQLLKRNRLHDKYYPPLTPTFRYYDETECYMEEYRLYKSPTVSRLDLEREYNYLTALTIDTMSSGSNESSPKPTKFKKSKEFRMKPRLRGEDETYLNNARRRGEDETYLNNARVSSGGSSKRIAIKIPKCETKNRRTIFPVILSRYSSSYHVNYN